MQNKFLLMLCLAFFCATAQAANVEKPLPDAAQEQTARTLFHELRCVVCQGQSVADSDAVLAAQMRAHVRKLVAEGKSEREILATFRESYGEQILMTPPVEPKTALLWLAPLALLMVGGWLVWRTTRSNSGDSA